VIYDVCQSLRRGGRYVRQFVCCLSQIIRISPFDCQCSTAVELVSRQAWIQRLSDGLSLEGQTDKCWSVTNTRRDRYCNIDIDDDRR